MRRGNNAYILVEALSVFTFFSYAEADGERFQQRVLTVDASRVDLFIRQNGLEFIFPEPVLRSADRQRIWLLRE